MAGTELNKPIVIFTSFWDANYLLSKEFFVSEINDNPIIVWLKNKDGKPHNYSVSSVALRAPSLDKLPIIKEKHGEMSRLDFFCPTYKILTDYKSDPIMKFNWELYKSRFKPLLQSRKSDILDWVDSLESNKIYFLCCWESTSEKVHCHRQIIYNAFKASKKISDKVISIYRHGNKQLDTHDDLNDKLDDNFINTYIVGPDSFKYIESVATLGIKDNSAESPHIQLQSQVPFDCIHLLQPGIVQNEHQTW